MRSERPRLLLVHAHPDDETITTGATMARYAAAGAVVALVTCTRGEQGEVIPPELAHLVADRDDVLGEYREGELAAAMTALGVADHRFLGLPSGRRYRDSGMTFDPAGAVVLPDDIRPDAFALADVEEAAGHLAVVIEELRPHVVVGYDPGGGYGHPDHIQAHRVTVQAVELAAQRTWSVPKMYWVVTPETVAQQHVLALAEPGNPFLPRPADGPAASMVMPDDTVTTVVDGSAFVTAKAAALRAHATQLLVDEPYFALSNRIGQLIAPVEYFRLIHGEPGAAGRRDAQGRETDLFAGL
jgi:N-acetyl-1-D-myo-inositol-2-amino-2-deoxy-alpha-D-glucopyranoside deacetylase